MKKCYMFLTTVLKLIKNYYSRALEWDGEILLHELRLISFNAWEIFNVF